MAQNLISSTGWSDGAGLISSAGWFDLPSAGGATATLTGVSSTVSAGSIAGTGAATVALTGVSVALSVGDIVATGAATIALTGVSSNLSAGGIIANGGGPVTAYITGVSSDMSAGDIVATGTVPVVESSIELVHGWIRDRKKKRDNYDFLDPIHMRSLYDKKEVVPTKTSKVKTVTRLRVSPVKSASVEKTGEAVVKESLTVGVVPEIRINQEITSTMIREKLINARYMASVVAFEEEHKRLADEEEERAIVQLLLEMV